MSRPETMLDDPDPVVRALGGCLVVAAAVCALLGVLAVATCTASLVDRPEPAARTALGEDA